MNRRNTFIVTAFGLWVSGMLVGANVIGFLPGEPSWPPGMIVAVALITSVGTFSALLKANR